MVMGLEDVGWLRVGWDVLVNEDIIGLVRDLKIFGVSSWGLWDVEDEFGDLVVLVKGIGVGNVGWKIVWVIDIMFINIVLVLVDMIIFWIMVFCGKFIILFMIFYLFGLFICVCFCMEFCCCFVLRVIVVVLYLIFCRVLVVVFFNCELVFCIECRIWYLLRMLLFDVNVFVRWYWFELLVIVFCDLFLVFFVWFVVLVWVLLLLRDCSLMLLDILGVSFEFFLWGKLCFLVFRFFIVFVIVIFCVSDGCSGWKVFRVIFSFFFLLCIVIIKDCSMSSIMLMMI